MIRQHVLTGNNFCKCVLLNGGDCDQELEKAKTSEGLKKLRDEGAMDCGTDLSQSELMPRSGKPAASKSLKHLPAASWNSARREGSVCTCPVSHTLSSVYVARQSKSGDVSLDIPLAS